MTLTRDETDTRDRRQMRAATGDTSQEQARRPERDQKSAAANVLRLYPPLRGGHKHDRCTRVDLLTHIAGKAGHVLWVRTHGGAILRGLRQILGVGSTETQRDGTRLMTIIAEHKVVARAWLWQGTGLPWYTFDTVTARDQGWIRPTEEYLAEWKREIWQSTNAREYLHQRTGHIIHSLGCQLRGSRKHIRRGRQKLMMPSPNEENQYMTRRLLEWTHRIPKQHRATVDEYLADLYGIGIVDGVRRKWIDAEATCTDMLRRLQNLSRPSPRQQEEARPQRRRPRKRDRRPLNPAGKEEATFRKIGRRSWYIIHNQMCGWKTGSRCDTASTGRRSQFSTMLAKLVPEGFLPARTPEVAETSTNYENIRFSRNTWPG